ncbi:MAG: UDP-N-acetylmuramate--L-alanine ligase [Marinilabiliaceae bacterium]|nr:UDP-N-acetylmuramate--L-alanine ligase [Marinilabiliaceae bacterium]
MVALENIKSLYFIGIGGIGMSALARFFKKQGKIVCGYDKTETDLTKHLVNEGIECCYVDDVSSVDLNMFQRNESLIVYTPAIPADNKIFNWFSNEKYDLLKRSQLLGVVSEKWDSICVAGTHGKTTVSTMTAHLFTQSKLKCHAFLGGISKNYQTNYLQAENSNWVVLEADEFDRSFLTLTPSVALITSVDADHLDIYNNKENVVEAFEQFLDRVKDHGQVVIKKNLELNMPKNAGCISEYRYSMEEEADFYAKNISLYDGYYRFDLVHPKGVIENIDLGVPGLVNVENAVAASSLALLSGVEPNEIKVALAGFKGIKRRFDYWLRNSLLTVIDDYAHHPEEIKATAKSVKAIYKNNKVLAVFQPHLYSRTKDFYIEFAKSLSLFDEVLLLDIYPAREMPLEGVTSDLIAKNMTVPVKIVQKNKLIEEIELRKPSVVITMGAGDIDKELPLITEYFLSKVNVNK